MQELNLLIKEFHVQVTESRRMARMSGYVTSGAYSPTFKKGLAMAMLSVDATQPENDVDVVIRDKKVKAKIVKLPFYDKKVKNKS